MEKTKKTSVPLTRVQRIIGERMLRSKRTKPCFYIETKADVTELMSMRPKLTRSLGVRITSNAFLIRALALAAGEFPLVLGRLNSAAERIEIADAVNVGFAVNTSQGVIVPVIKNADEKELAQIARLEKLYTDKARSNRLTLREMEAETIAFSNLGAYATDSFLAIVPPPASIILAVGNVLRTLRPINGKAVLRKLISLCLAADRRVVDEVCGSRFLGRIRELLEDPQSLV